MFLIIADLIATDHELIERHRIPALTHPKTLQDIKPVTDKLLERAKVLGYITDANAEEDCSGMAAEGHVRLYVPAKIPAHAH